MTELDEFMDYCHKTNVEVVLDRLKESARHNESMLNYWKVVKKRRKRDAMKRKIRLRPFPQPISTFPPLYRKREKIC